MWLCTQHGFYSIVRKADGAFHVRARRRQDLVNLRDLVFGRGYRRALRWTIHRTQPADYRWRIIVHEADRAVIFAGRGSAIDYTNFKARIHARPDQREKAHAYGCLWAELHHLQEEGA